MANGFGTGFSGGLARGLQSGFGTVSNAMMNRENLSLRRRTLEQEGEQAQIENFKSMIEGTRNQLQQAKQRVRDAATEIVQNAETDEQATEALKPLRRQYQALSMQEAQLGKNILSVAQRQGFEVPQGIPSPEEKVKNDLAVFNSLTDRVMSGSEQVRRLQQEAFAEERGRQMAEDEFRQLDVQNTFSAITNGDERITILETDQGLFTQEVGQDGEPIFTPVDSRNIRQVTTQETGTTEELGLGKTEQRQLNDAEVATRDFIQTTGDALGLLEQSPDVNTWVGRLGGIVNDLKAEAKATGRAFGMEFDEDIFDIGVHEDTFARLGIENRRMQSLITSMAFQAAAASGQTGRAISDRDVQRFIREIGASASDPDAFATVLRDVAERTDRRFRTNFEVRTDEPFRESLGLDQLPGGSPTLPEGIPEGSVPVGQTATGGTVYETPDGEQLVVE